VIDQLNIESSEKSTTAAKLVIGNLSITFVPVIAPSRRILFTRIIVIAAPSEEAHSVTEVLREIERYLPTSKRPYLLSILGVRFDPSLLDWTFPENVMFEIPGSCLIEEAMQEVVRKLRERDVKLVLRGRSNGSLPREFFHNFEMSIIQDRDDTRKNRDRQVPLAGVTYRRLPFMIAGLSTPAEETEAFSRDAIGSVGWIERPRIVDDIDTIHPSRRIIELMLEVVEAKGELEQVMALLRYDPVLLLKFLRFIQSSLDSSTRVNSLSHCLTIVGYFKLRRWLLVQLDDAVSATHDMPQYYQVSRRAYIMESLCSTGADAREKAYLTGMMSMLENIAGVDQEKARTLFASMGEFGADILAESSSVAGKVAMTINLASLIEKNELPSIPKVARGLAIPMADINVAVLKAIELAENMDEVLQQAK
jgi:c-di-GMP-related signal transduction protein